jgi:LytS/YehU family sensor histidine kinase
VGNVLIMVVSNHKVNMKVTDSEKSGLGISNTRKRLDLLYPAKYILNITDETEVFTINLTINLQ